MDSIIDLFTYEIPVWAWLAAAIPAAGIGELAKDIWRWAKVSRAGADT